MRNGKRYVAVRLMLDEKARFVGIAKQCNIPEKTLLLWLMETMPIREYPPEKFWKLNRLLLRLTTNISCICLKHNLPEQYKDKYYRLGDIINHHDYNITFRSVYADPDYANDHED